VKKSNKFKPKKPVQSRQSRHFYPTEYKQKAVQMHLEDGVSVRVVAEQLGCSFSVLAGWIKAYRKKGPAGLAGRRGVQRLPAAVKAQIVAMKQAQPSHGTHKISNFLKRVFFMKASHETVRRVLQKESLLTERKKRKPKAVVRRTKQEIEEGSSYVKGPNLMWQSDISVFLWNKQAIYLIGFLDDFSRFMTGLGIYLAQKAENVLETFRRSTQMYPAPKEMLTDNGRQYTSWRGRSEFEKEMTRAQIRHIRSRPHHPQTLGKIERFWKTIKEEFLSQTLFENFEDLQDRTRLWVQYYNFQRPHQGIGGLCPADKFYEMSQDIRKVMEQGIADNVQQMALLGVPRKPCYLVGRVENQSVTVVAEKGQLKLQVSDLESRKRQEMVYPLPSKNGINNITEGEVTYGTFEREDEKQAQRIELGNSCGSLPGGAVSVDGKANAVRSVPGTVDTMDNPPSLAEAGDGGNATGAGAQSESRESTGAESKAASSAVGTGKGPDGAGAVGTVVSETGAATGDGHRQICEGGIDVRGHETSGKGGVNGEPAGGGTCPDNPGSTERPDDGRGGGESALGLTENLLPVGEERASGPSGSACERVVGTSDRSGGPGERGPEEGGRPAEKGVVRGPGEPPCPTGVGCVQTAA
jgi:transposase InsO family protein